MELTKRTQEDLEALRSIQVEIQKLKDREREILHHCVHENYRPGIFPTFAFEFTPASACVICNKRGTLTDDEKRAEVLKFHAEMDLSITTQEVEIKKNGWNI